MRMKKGLSLLLSVALTASLILPAGAANSSFADVSDADTAVNADILRLMGVADGVGGNQFNPNATLTRAEFCTMVVKFMQKGDEVPLHATRTIFNDVTARHWGLGYINLAASLTVKDGDTSIPLISGVGNGKFEPDSQITLAQAATILIRVLGYSSQQAGAVWPQSYMNLAGSIGLTDRVNAQINAPITRAQAAQLFVNALSCKTGSGEVYYTTLGTCAEDTIILAVDVTTGDGTSDGAIRTSKEADPYLPAAGKVKPTALQGKRGAMVLNDRDEIVTFVPDDSTAVHIILSGDAQPSYVRSTDGQQYTVPGNALVYTADAQEGGPYSTSSDTLKSGVQLTMYSERGKIVAIYAGGSMSASSNGAVVVMGTPSVAMFHQLTGGVSNFTVQKNRQPIALSDLKEYDVVTYDSLSNTLTASDLRLTCVYEDAAPNPKAPTTITVLGHTFDVLDSAWDTIQKFPIGSNVTLLLTADGRVAGMAKPGSKIKSTAIGVVTGDGAEMFLPNGSRIHLKGAVSQTDRVENQLAVLSSSRKGKLGAVLMEGKTAAGAFCIDEMTLGRYTVANGVHLFERVNGGAVVPIDLGDLGEKTVGSTDIAAYHLNSSGFVDYIVLKSVTGDAYTYGLLRKGEQSGGSGDLAYTNLTVTVENGTGELGTLLTGFSFQDGGFGGVVRGYGSVDGMSTAASVIELTEIKKVVPGDFFVSQGVSYVNAGGKIYRVWDDVECYKKKTQSWCEGETGQARLAVLKAFSDDLTVYIDPIGEKVRVIVAN